jgi:hypothetical protein
MVKGLTLTALILGMKMPGIQGVFTILTHPFSILFTPANTLNKNEMEKGNGVASLSFQRRIP